MNQTILAKLIGRPEVGVEALPVTGRYPEDVLTRESVKGGLGLAVCVGLVAVVQPSPWVSVPLLMVGVLFGLYLKQQVGRFSLRFQVDDTGLTTIRGGKRKAYRWSELRDFRLNYYAHGRKSGSGTLVVIVDAGQGRIKIDSTMDHFPTLLERSARAALEQNLELHPTTLANLEQLGLIPVS